MREQAGDHPGSGRDPRRPLTAWVRGGQWAVALTLTALVVAAHVACFLHAGALWRDEINSVNVAGMPSFSQFSYYTRWDSFPIGWPLVLRAYLATGLGGTDTGLRALGLGMGLAALAALWWTARSFTRDVPLVSLALAAAAPAVIRYGDAVRAYGLGILLSLLAMGLLWRAVQRPDWRRLAAAAAAAVLSVNVIYHNAILLLALGVGGTAVGLLHRDWKRVAGVLGIGLVSAAALLAINWRHLTSAGEWNTMVKTTVSLEWLFTHKVMTTLNASGEFMTWLWLVMLAVALGACVYRLVRPAGPEGAQRDLPLFILTAMPVAVVGYFWFLRAVSYVTEPWYYVALMVFLAVLIEAAVHTVVQANTVGRIVRLALVVVVAALIAPNVWREVHTRMTNLDLVAAKLEALASQDDFVIVTTYHPGITFNRYYRGPTPWATLPDIRDHRVHRMDEIKEKMAEREPLRPVLQKMAQTLASGHRVWVVGKLWLMRPGERPGYLPPAPQGPTGWYEQPYVDLWLGQAGYFIQCHANRLSRVPVPVDDPVSQYEEEMLLVIEGWR